MHHRALALLGATLALCVQQCAADVAHTFLWKLGNNVRFTCTDRALSFRWLMMPYHTARLG